MGRRPEKGEDSSIAANSLPPRHHDDSALQQERHDEVHHSGVNYKHNVRNYNTKHSFIHEQPHITQQAEYDHEIKVKWAEKMTAMKKV